MKIAARNLKKAKTISYDDKRVKENIEGGVPKQLTSVINATLSHFITFDLLLEMTSYFFF